MSRTKSTGGKGVGYEVDRKGEGKRGWRDAGALAKRIGSRAGRRLDKAAIADETEDTPDAGEERGE